jgi:hypothetical protein
MLDLDVFLIPQREEKASNGLWNIWWVDGKVNSSRFMNCIFQLQNRRMQMMEHIFISLTIELKKILQRFCSNFIKHTRGMQTLVQLKPFHSTSNISNKMNFFNEHTLITIIGPTALTSYVRSKDDFSTLLNVVSVLQIEEYD